MANDAKALGESVRESRQKLDPAIESGARRAAASKSHPPPVYELDDDMAMSIGDTFEPDAVDHSDWVDMSHDCDLPIEPFLALVREAAGRTLECATRVAELAQAEGWHVPLIDQIVEVVKGRAIRIAAQLAPATS